MKYIIRCYRILKPAAVYTSYLFTSLTMLYLLFRAVFPELLSFSEHFLWGIFAFSLGSILLQRIFLGSRLMGQVPYVCRLLFYMGAAGTWGIACLYLFRLLSGTKEQTKVLSLALLAGILCCCAFELFNRCRAHIYNTLLEQYKKRKRS